VFGAVGAVYLQTAEQQMDMIMLKVLHYERKKEHRLDARNKSV
jgi:hypothetical protein